MVRNRLPKANHVRLDVFSVGVYDAIVHFNNAEKAVLDIMELLKVDRGFYMTKSCRSVNMRRKRSSSYRMLEPQKKRHKVLRPSKTSNKTKTLKLKEPHMKRGAFKTQY